MRHFTPIALVAALALVGFNAQAQIVSPVNPVASVNPTDLFWDVPQGMPSNVASFASATQLRGFALGGNSIRLTEAPVLTGCITGGGTIAGSDAAFVLTGGSTASTSCVATFTTAWTTRPVCSVTSQTAYATTTPSYTVSTTAVTITQASNSSEVYDVICVGQPGG